MGNRKKQLQQDGLVYYKTIELEDGDNQLNMSLLPKSVYLNPKFHWLFPNCENGRLVTHVYYQLMKGLESLYPEKRQRHFHIIRNMLFMIELSPRYFRILRELFGTCANISKSQYIAEKVKWCKEFECQSYDLIIGTIPMTCREINYTLVHYELVTPNGYLLFETNTQYQCIPILEQYHLHTIRVIKPFYFFVIVRNKLYVLLTNHKTKIIEDLLNTIYYCDLHPLLR